MPRSWILPPGCIPSNYLGGSSLPRWRRRAVQKTFSFREAITAPAHVLKIKLETGRHRSIELESLPLPTEKTDRRNCRMRDTALSSASRIAEPASGLLQPKHQLLGLSANRGSTQILAELRATIAVGGVNLDAMLQRIVDAAQMFTDANGAAIALQHDNWVVCRARSGDMAPELNSKLDTGSGISGECLRSGKALWCLDTSADSRVDAAACRRLGLRSLAAAPIGEKPSVQGILEAFSARPYAFGDTEVSLLKELAELVIAAQQGSTKPAAPLTSMHETLARKALSVSKRTLVAVAFVTLAFVVWLGLRKRPD